MTGGHGSKGSKEMSGKTLTRRISGGDEHNLTGTEPLSRIPQGREGQERPCEGLIQDRLKVDESITATEGTVQGYDDEGIAGKTDNT